MTYVDSLVSSMKNDESITIVDIKRLLKNGTRNSSNRQRFLRWLLVQKLKNFLNAKNSVAAYYR